MYISLQIGYSILIEEKVVYRLREAISLSKRRGRVLTAEEMKKYEI